MFINVATNESRFVETNINNYCQCHFCTLSEIKLPKAAVITKRGTVEYMETCCLRDSEEEHNRIFSCKSCRAVTSLLILISDTFVVRVYCISCFIEMFERSKVINKLDEVACVLVAPVIWFTLFYLILCIVLTPMSLFWILAIIFLVVVSIKITIDRVCSITTYTQLCYDVYFIFRNGHKIPTYESLKFN